MHIHIYYKCIEKVINKYVMNPIKRKMVNKCGDKVYFGINAEVAGKMFILAMTFLLEIIAIL